MSKVTKKMLKSLVKECLVEILSEGIGGNSIISESSTRSPRSSKKKKTSLDQMNASFERKPRADESAKFSNRVSQIASAATSDPILQSILEDTAKTTMQEQIQHESGIPTMGNVSSAASVPTMGRGSAGLDIESLFGESTKNWGELIERTERKTL